MGCFYTFFFTALAKAGLVTCDTIQSNRQRSDFRFFNFARDVITAG